ncbi:MAG: hypothetical protein Q8Q18_03230 [bacterium]|nr:hypothetical protein [bacterium]
MVRLIFVFFVLAVVLAIPATFVAPVDFESAVALRASDELGPWTQLAAKRWPVQTLQLAGLYGQELERAIAAGGERAVPVIFEMTENGSAYFDFVSNVAAITGSASAGLTAALDAWQKKEDVALAPNDSVLGKARAWASWVSAKTTSVVSSATNKTTQAWQRAEPLSPFDRGLVSIQAIQSPDGGSFLDQFTVSSDGTVTRSSLKTAANVAEFFFVSGLITVERKLESGEGEIETSEAISAALETTLLLGGAVKMIAGVARSLEVGRVGSRMAKVAEATGTVAKTSGRVAKAVTFSRVGRMSIAVGALALCASCPGVVNDLLAKAATLAGISIFWVQFFGWCAIFTIILLPLAIIWLPLLRFAVWLTKGLVIICEMAYSYFAKLAKPKKKEADCSCA